MDLPKDLTYPPEGRLIFPLQSSIGESSMWTNPVPRRVQ